MKILTHTSFKGGTGKTTLNALTAITLAKQGNKVLMIDLDPNCCLSQIYHKELSDQTSKDLISGTSIKPYNVAENLDLIPSSLDMALLQNIMDSTLKNMIRKFEYSKTYDYIVIDPPGSWNSHTRNAIFAADILIVTGTISSLDYFATIKYFEQLQSCYLDAEVKIICNRFNKQKNEPGIYEKYQEQFKDFLIKEPISDIKSLKYLTADPNYPIQATVKKGLENYVNEIIKEEV